MEAEFMKKMKKSSFFRKKHFFKIQKWGLEKVNSLLHTWCVLQNVNHAIYTK